MEKALFSVFSLLLISIFLYGNSKTMHHLYDAFLPEVEALSGQECMVGGEGSSSCNWQILQIGCGISCNSGYYACCNFWSGCSCIPYE